MVDTGHVVTRVQGLGRLLLHGDAMVARAAGERFGAAVPDQPCRAAFEPPRAALWLGPDEFLLLLPEALVATTMSELSTALGDLPHALVDISQRQLGVAVEGPDAALLLNAGCPLDLDLATFPVNACARTLFGKAEIVVWRMAPERFHLEVGRSFMPYVDALLREASRGLT